MDEVTKIPGLLHTHPHVFFFSSISAWAVTTPFVEIVVDFCSSQYFWQLFLFVFFNELNMNAVGSLDVDVPAMRCYYLVNMNSSVWMGLQAAFRTNFFFAKYLLITTWTCGFVWRNWHATWRRHVFYWGKRWIHEMQRRRRNFYS